MGKEAPGPVKSSLTPNATGAGPLHHHSAQSLSPPQVDKMRLQKVIANMEKDKALQFRQNTGNRGYGFSQMLAKNAPEQHLHVRESQQERENGGYRFSVAGNHKA